MVLQPTRHFHRGFLHIEYLLCLKTLKFTRYLGGVSTANGCSDRNWICRNDFVRFWDEMHFHFRGEPKGKGFDGTDWRNFHWHCRLILLL